MNSSYRGLRTPLFVLLILATVFGLGLVASAGAIETDARVATVRARLLEAIQNSRDVCPTSADPNIREYLFVFEGAGGYAPARAILGTSDLFTNIRLGEELFPEAWKPGFSRPGLPTDANGQLIFPESWSPEKINLYRLAILRLEADGNSGMLELIDRTKRYAGYGRAGHVPIYPKRALYYNFTSPISAATCAESLKKLYDRARLPIAFSASGFSLGGYATVRFARAMHSANLRLRNVFTIDPVPYTHEIVRALNGRRNGTVIQVPGNHDHWYNIHQRLAEATLKTPFGDFGIRGAKLSGGVKNRIPVQNSGYEISGHLEILRSDVAIAEMGRILDE